MRKLLIFMLLICPAVWASVGLSGVSMNNVKITPYVTTGYIFDAATNSITGYVGTDTKIVIPRYIGGEQVKSIASNVFNNKAITHLALPEGFVSLGMFAFANNSLSSLVLPDTITTVGYGVFQFNQIANLTLPANLEVIETEAFRQNSLTSLTIPSSCIIKTRAFLNNSSLVTVTIPDACSIYVDVFKNNPITTINIGSGVGIYSDASMGSNGTGFTAAYTAGGAGTYVYADGAWGKL